MDGDGWSALNETVIGTDPSDPCGGNAWPADLVPGGFQPNALNVQDVASFTIPVRHLNTSVGDPGFSPRWDLIPGATVGEDINVADIGALVTGATGYPPMFAGQRAFGQTCPFAP